MKCDRAGRVRELPRSSRSRLKMVWHQFSIVQFPSHQFVWKARSVQVGARGPNASVQSVQFSSVYELFQPWLGSALARFSSSSLQLFWRSRGAGLGPLQLKSQAAGPGFAAWV